MSRLVLNKQSSAPGAQSAGKAALFLDNTTIPRLRLEDENGNVFTQLDANHNPWPAQNASVAQQTGFAADQYLTGSAIVIPAAGLWQVASTYRLVFDMTKTGAGVATPIITIRMGTLGTTGDTGVLTITFAVGTAVIDTGIFEVLATFRTVGSGSAAVLQAVARCTHHLAATGLTTTGASGTGIILATSAGFASNTPTIIGASFNGGTSFAGTNQLVQANLQGLNT